MKTEIKAKRDHLTGVTVWSIREFLGNQFCGHWHEIGRALTLSDARARLALVRP